MIFGSVALSETIEHSSMTFPLESIVLIVYPVCGSVLGGFLMFPILNCILSFEAAPLLNPLVIVNLLSPERNEQTNTEFRFVVTLEQVGVDEVITSP